MSYLILHVLPSPPPERALKQGQWPDGGPPHRMQGCPQGEERRSESHVQMYEHLLKNGQAGHPDHDQGSGQETTQHTQQPVSGTHTCI